MGELISEAAIKDAWPRLVGALAGHFRDLDLAEDAAGEAVTALLQQDCVIEDVAGWLYVTARRRALDSIRKRNREMQAVQGNSGGEPMAEVIQLPDPIPDERLRLIFICCHPALSLEARAALTMRVVCGVPAERIAKAFLVQPSTMNQRLTRAKAKIRLAGIPFETPGRREWRDRLQAVLLTLELVYTVSYSDGAVSKTSASFGGEVVRLARLLSELFPDEPEVLGLQALVLLAGSRSGARIAQDGAMIPLSQQDPALWDAALIKEARLILDHASDFGEAGPYQIMAFMHLAHAARIHEKPVDHRAILAAYDALAKFRPTAAVAINRAVALARVQGAEAGLKALDALDADRLENFLPYHAARAHLYRDTGDSDAACAACIKAIALEPMPEEKLYLEQFLTELGSAS